MDELTDAMSSDEFSLTERGGISTTAYAQKRKELIELSKELSSQGLVRFS